VHRAHTVACPHLNDHNCSFLAIPFSVQETVCN